VSIILTITPNPTLDRVMLVREFRMGAVVRGEREVITPSGKGVDVSLVVHELGGDTLAVGLKAGFAGNLLTSMLDEIGVPYDLVPAHGETRIAVVLVDLATGQQSTILTPTMTATEEHLSRLLALLDLHAGHAWGVVCGGSLPPGLPLDSHARLLRRARQRGLVTLLDSSGESLRQGVVGLPYILKINRQELASLDPDTGRGSGDVGDVAHMAERLAARLGEWASEALIVTLGERGTLAVVHGGRYHAQPPQVAVANTAGAGDALTAGIMLARSRGTGWPEALALGTAAAASVVMNEGTAVCRRRQVDALLPQVRVVSV